MLATNKYKQSLLEYQPFSWIVDKQHNYHRRHHSFHTFTLYAGSLVASKLTVLPLNQRYARVTGKSSAQFEFHQLWWWQNKQTIICFVPRKLILLIRSCHHLQRQQQRRRLTDYSCRLISNLARLLYQTSLLNFLFCLTCNSLKVLRSEVATTTSGHQQQDKPLVTSVVL